MNLKGGFPTYPPTPNPHRLPMIKIKIIFLDSYSTELWLQRQVIVLPSSENKKSFFKQTHLHFEDFYCTFNFFPKTFVIFLTSLVAQGKTFGSIVCSCACPSAEGWRGKAFRDRSIVPNCMKSSSWIFQMSTIYSIEHAISLGHAPVLQGMSVWVSPAWLVAQLLPP